MKPSKTLLPLALAAAAPSVLASSSSPRRLSGKSGKAASGVATPEDYTWLVGSYTDCIQSGVYTINGVQPPTSGQDPNPFVDIPCADGERLEIVHLGGFSFQATLFRVTADESKLKWVYFGTGSYNHAKAGNIVFASDYTYIFNGTEWVDIDDPDISDNEILECSQLSGYEDGESIVCDFLSDAAVPNGEYALTATGLFTDPSK